MGGETKDTEDNLLKLLTQYRTMAHSATGEVPCKLLFNYNIRNRLDLLKPKQKTRNDIGTENARSNETRVFCEGERVAARNYNDKNIKWKFGQIQKSLGNVHYEIKLDNNQVWKRHVNQIRKIGENTPKSTDQNVETQNVPNTCIHYNEKITLSSFPRYKSKTGKIQGPLNMNLEARDPGPHIHQESRNDTVRRNRPIELVLRSSNRTPKKPKHYGDFVTH